MPAKPGAKYAGQVDVGEVNSHVWHQFREVIAACWPAALARIAPTGRAPSARKTRDGIMSAGTRSRILHKLAGG
jgi:hypothetical protein